MSRPDANTGRISATDLGNADGDSPWHQPWHQSIRPPLRNQARRYRQPAESLEWDNLPQGSGVQALLSQVDVSSRDASTPRVPLLGEQCGAEGNISIVLLVGHHL